ncbi:MAG: hypothetical protein ACN6OP_17160 [Pseudomonadales bacterium]
MDKLNDAALDAAKTYIAASENYCLLFIDWWPMCMTKSEWSGWMQACVAALAIGASTGFAFYQYLKEQKRRRQNSWFLLNEYFSAVAFVITNLSDHFEVEHTTLKFFRVWLENQNRSAENVENSEVGARGAQAIVILKMATTQILQALEEVEAVRARGGGQGGANDAFQDLARVLEMSKFSLNHAKEYLAGNPNFLNANI